MTRQVRPVVPEMRGNWEGSSTVFLNGVAWPSHPSERTCPLCRQGLLHSLAEHELLYGPARKVRDERERAESAAQTERDVKLLAKLQAQGMTELEAVNELLRMVDMGEYE